MNRLINIATPAGNMFRQGDGWVFLPEKWERTSHSFATLFACCWKTFACCRSASNCCRHTSDCCRSRLNYRRSHSDCCRSPSNCCRRTFDCSRSRSNCCRKHYNNLLLVSYKHLKYRLLYADTSPPVCIHFRPVRAT